MTDRDLLEAAARAAGIVVKFTESPKDGCYLFEDGEAMGWWNPLADDGDALRLAVRLRMSLRRETLPHSVSVVAYTESGSARETLKDVRLSTQPNEAEATRRAIVRAAAAMGGSDE